MLRPEAPKEAPASSSREPQRQKKRAQATQKRLLDAAEREFAARGFAGARLREIADTAGVQPALIHHYFTDKQGLYRAVLDRAMAESSAESWSVLESQRDLEGLVSGLVDLLVRFHAAHQSLLSILRYDLQSGSSVMIDVCKERMAPVIEAVEAYLEERQRAGEVRADLPASEIVIAGLSMVVHPFMESSLFDALMPASSVHDEESLSRRKRAIVAMLLGGIRA